MNITHLRFVVALVFLGLSWNVNNLAGDVFLNFFLTSIAEIVGFLLCIPLLDRVGRKPVYVVSLFMGGFALLLTMVPVLLGSPGKTFHQCKIETEIKICKALSFPCHFKFLILRYINFDLQFISCSCFLQIHNG